MLKRTEILIFQFCTLFNLILKLRCSYSVGVTDCYIIRVFHFLVPLRNVEISFYLHLISWHFMSKYGGVSPRFHNLGTRSWWIASSTTRPRSLLENSPWCTEASRFGRTHCRLGRCEAKKIHCSTRVNSEVSATLFYFCIFIHI